MKVVKIGDRQNMLQLQNGAKTSYFKINPSNTECLALVKTLTVGDEVHVQYTTNNGVDYINELTIGDAKPSEVAEEVSVVPTEEKTEVDTNVGVNNNFSEPDKPEEFKCKTCGAKLRDGKYETCYTCSMKARDAAGGSNKSPEVQASIKRQAIGNMTARTMIALRGTPAVDEDKLTTTIETIYKLYQNLVG